MEQANYWMWMRRKLGEKSHVQVQRTYDESWEEQAFAEDSSGPLGGCIWPPRSYSCSFCRREFRSAQALGGHMNVHRRDRARLKQSPNPHSSDALQHQHQQQNNPCISLGVQYPSQVSSLSFNPNPNSDPSAIASPRVSVQSTQENCSGHTLISPSYSSHMFQQQSKGSRFSAPAKESESVTFKVLTLFDSKLEGEKDSKESEIGFGEKAEYVEPDSELSFNLVVHRNRPLGLRSDEEGSISSKRRRIDETSLPFFPKPKSVDMLHIQSKVLGLIPTSVDELDLELRLGDRPKVK